MQWGLLPGSLLIGDSFGVVIKFEGPKIICSQGKTDAQVDPNMHNLIKDCVGVIFIRNKEKMQIKGSGTIIHAFKDHVPKAIQFLALTEGGKFTIPLGIVLTAAHVIRGA